MSTPDQSRPGAPQVSPKANRFEGAHRVGGDTGLDRAHSQLEPGELPDIRRRESSHSSLPSRTGQRRPGQPGQAAVRAPLSPARSEVSAAHPPVENQQNRPAATTTQTAERRSAAEGESPRAPAAQEPEREQSGRPELPRQGVLLAERTGHEDTSASSPGRDRDRTGEEGTGRETVRAGDKRRAAHVTEEHQESPAPDAGGAGRGRDDNDHHTRTGGSGRGDPGDVPGENENGDQGHHAEQQRSARSEKLTRLDEIFADQSDVIRDLRIAEEHLRKIDGLSREELAESEYPAAFDNIALLHRDERFGGRTALQYLRAGIRDEETVSSPAAVTDKADTASAPQRTGRAAQHRHPVETSQVTSEDGAPPRAVVTVHLPEGERGSSLEIPASPSNPRIEKGHARTRKVQLILDALASAEVSDGVELFKTAELYLRKIAGLPREERESIPLPKELNNPALYKINGELGDTPMAAMRALVAERPLIKISDLAEQFPDISGYRRRQLTRHIPIIRVGRDVMIDAVETSFVLKNWMEEQQAKIKARAGEMQLKLESDLWGSLVEIRRLTGLPDEVLGALLRTVPRRDTEGGLRRFNIPEALQRAEEAPPRADRETGLYVDQEGDTWIPRSQVAERLGITEHAAGQLVAIAASMPVIANNRRQRPYFSERQLQQLYTEGQQRPAEPQPIRVEVVRTGEVTIVTFRTKDGSAQTQADFGDAKINFPDRVDYDGTIHASVRHLIKGTGIGRKKGEKLLADMEGILGQAANGRYVILYPEPEAKAILAQEEKRREESLIRKRAQRKQKPDPELWESEQGLAEEYGLPATVIRRVLEETQRRTWRNARHYQRSEARTEIRRYIHELPDEEGIRTVDGIEKAQLWYFHKKTGMAYSTLRKLFKELEIARGQEGIILYGVDEGMAILEAEKKIPQVDRETGIYTDPGGTRIAPYTVLGDMFGISHDTVGIYTMEMDPTPVRGRNRRLTGGYDVDVFEILASEYLARPTLGDVVVVGQQETSIVAAGTLATEFDLPPETVKRLLSPIKIDLRGTSANGYPGAPARERLTTFTKRAKIDPETNQYTAADGRVFVTLNEATGRLGVDNPFLRRAIERTDAPLSKLPGRRDGFELTLYDLAELERLRDNPPPRRRPQRQPRPEDPERYPKILRDARALLDDGVKISRQGLRGAGSFGLDARIQRTQGGYEKVLKDLGIEVTEPKRIDWSKIRYPRRYILSRVKKYIADHPDEKDLSKILIAVGISKSAVDRYYPTPKRGNVTGYAKLQSEAGLKPPKIDYKRMSQRDRDANLEQWAKKFIADGGVLTRLGLKGAHSARLRAIRLYYSTGIEGLQRKFGVVDTTRKVTRWSQMEDPAAAIRAAVNEEMQGREDFTVEELSPRLISAIYHNYPGAWRQLCIDRAQEKNNKMQN